MKKAPVSPEGNVVDVETEHSVARRILLFSLLMAGCVIAVAVIALIGWACDLPVLKSLLPGWVSMKVNTAIEFLLCGIALGIACLPKTCRILRGIAVLLGAFVIVLASLTLLQYLINVDFGIDQLLFGDASSSLQTSHPGRQAPTTALCFILAGLASVIASLSFLPRARLALLKALGTTVAFIGVFALVGYIAETFFDQRWWTYTGMAFHTSLAFVLLGLGFYALTLAEQPFAWHLDHPTTWGFLCGIMLIVIAAHTAYIHTSQLLKTSTLVAHRQDVLKELRQIRSLISSLESSQRGFIITGEESQLADRPENVAAVTTAMGNVRHLTRDNPAQQEALTNLDRFLTARIRWEEETIAARGNAGFATAAAMISTGRGREALTQLYGQLRAMEEEEFSLLARDKTDAETAATTAFLFLPMEIFLSLAILFGGLFFLNAGLGERAAAEHNLLASIKKEKDIRDALNAHAIVATTDPQGKITFANEKFCAISKYSSDELLGQDHRIINSGHHPKEFFRTLWSTIARGQVWKGEVKNRARDGSFYWVDTTIVPFLDDRGKPRQYVVIRTDITERKLAEEEILSLNAGLEQRVAERTSELRATNRELDSFCYSVSHDLRAPLRGIGGFAKILVEDYAPQLDETARGYLRRVQSAADRMGELIDDLLKLSRVSREDFNLQTVNVSEIARSIADNLRQCDPGRSAEFHIENGLEAEADPRLLRVLLENLFNNAWKFTSKKPHALIEFAPASPRDGRVVFSLRDNGAGFDMEYAGKLFSPFQRLHGMNEFPGTGIGLATVQRIIHRHGGEVWVEAAVAQGATFFFSLKPPSSSHGT